MVGISEYATVTAVGDLLNFPECTSVGCITALISSRKSVV